MTLLHRNAYFRGPVTVKGTCDYYDLFGETQKTYSTHPLNAALSDDARTTRRILMFTRTLDDIGDRSLAAMRVIGKTLHKNLQTSVFDSDAAVTSRRRTAP